MHITLYRKYRPSNFFEVFGENEIIKTIKISLKNNSMAHAYIFFGPRGVGKTTTARLIAKGVNCLNLSEEGEPCNCCKNCLAINEGRFSDLIEIDAASNRSIDEIRNLKEKINYQPVEGIKKVYIIDEAHMLTKEAFNALLKTLEEPPKHVLFILATTELDKILPTIISRCQRYDFKPLNIKEMKERLSYILKEENYEIEEEVFSLIYDNSFGSMRDAISILERLIISSNENKINLKNAEEILGITPSERIEIFLEKLLSKNYYEIIENIEKISLESLDIELFFKDVAKYCKEKMLKNELDIAKSLLIIESIYDVLGKFKFEDDKKMVAYVIVSEILSKLSEDKKEKNIVHIIQENKDTNQKTLKNIKENNIDFNDIKNNWNKIVEEAKKEKMTYKLFLSAAKPVRLEQNTLYIAYNKENLYYKEQMESQDYRVPFLKILRDFYSSQEIDIEYEIINSKNKNENDLDEFSKEVRYFFEGEER